MSPSTLAAIIGLALLTILLPIAIVQRRSQAVDVAPTFAPPDATAQPAVVISGSMTVSKVALGVCLGLWLFVLTVVTPAMLTIKYYTNR